MKYAAGILLLALIGETLGLALFARVPFHPDFLLGIVVLVAITRKSPTGAVAGFFLGLLRDIIYGYPVGFAAFPLAVVGWVVGSLGRSVYREAVMTQIVVLFLASIGNSAFEYTLLRGGEISGLFSYLLRFSLLSSLETAILVPMLYKAGRDIFVGRKWQRLLLDRLRAYERKILVKRQ